MRRWHYASTRAADTLTHCGACAQPFGAGEMYQSGAAPYGAWALYVCVRCRAAEIATTRGAEFAARYLADRLGRGAT